MIVLREANQIKITDAAHVAAVFRDLLALEDTIARDTEHYYVMHLDVRHTVKLVELVSSGILDSARVHPRETFRRAIVRTGEILGIPLIDHIVFTSDKYYSFRANLAGVLRE